MDQSSDPMIRMFEQMTRIREFEERAANLMEQSRIPGAVHLYVGQEAIAVGVCEALRSDDYITSTHRGHGHLIAKGGEARFMFAELFGRDTGYNRGKGGSMHIANLDLGILGANGIVGAGAPIALGAAFGSAYKGDDRVVVCFFGDGASNEGAFHEAANMAAVLKLPLVFVCENNLYGEWTPIAQQTAVKDVADRAAAYDMPGVIADGMDVMAVYETATEAIARARAGGGPSLLEFKTYRFYDHVGRNFGILNRDKDEVASWKARDPITQWQAKLEKQGVLSAKDAAEVTMRIQKEMDDALEFAEQSPEPGPEALMRDVYTVGTAS